ncbi:flagellar protein [Alkalihalophilus pseudofirmus]|uniref:Flagellar protein FliT n=1 Tax=Alkalihalophilus pseudofirmus TaxID=79885 RepID=A0AAJ2NPM3_ALKPS|nr:flagellar protein [Alkalihalophilus pseudofirmus]MDV2886264.1 flagellar protein [Alkalihalophilus pseudofirmus]
MSLVKELYIATQSLYEHVGKPLPKEDDSRDQFIAIIDLKLEHRAALIEQIEREDLTAGEKKLGDELIKLNTKLNARLEVIKAEIQANLSELKVKKQTHRKYENPYDGPTTDGVFFDKRGV